MGSYTSRARTNVDPKPLEVLPATESWSTLDAFQATVKKDGHHELINRSRTQKSLIKTNSLLLNNYNRRTKTLNVIPANSSPSPVQSRNPIIIRSKTQATLSPEKPVGKEEDSIDQYPSKFSESSLNARRPTHFYEVRQAMVNRKPLKKLESIGSMSVSNDLENVIKSTPSLSEKANGKANSASKPENPTTLNIIQHSPNFKVKANSKTSLANRLVAAPNLTASTNKSACEPEMAVSQPTGVKNLVTCTTKSDHVEHLIVASPSETKTETVSLSAVQLETKPDATQNDMTSLHNSFKVDPAPHATFAPDSLPSECELKCQVTVAELTLFSSEESTRKELEGILQQWEESGHLASIEAYALSVPPSQTATIKQLASSLVNSNAGYTKAAEGNKLHIQVAQAYCIYVWIANNIIYDVEQFKANLSGDESSKLMNNIEAEEVLDTRVTVCTGYANLFKALALAAGLEAETVHGHVKQWKCLSEEKPADIPFKPNRENAHTWNTVSNYYVKILKEFELTVLELQNVVYTINCQFGSLLNTTCMHFGTKPN